VDTLPENDRIRYTMSKEARKELLQRLLKLNLQKTTTAAPQKKSKPKNPKTNTQKLGF